MSVEAPSAGEDFSVRVIMKQDAVIPVRWANTHELSTNVGGITFGGWEAFAEAVRDFHRFLLVPDYKVERVIISTLAEDGAPYNPSNLAVFEYNVAGLRTSGGTSDVYDLRTVLHLKRDVDFGREGNLLLRGFLKESDVTTVGGTTRLNDIPAVQLEVDAAINDTTMQNYIGAGAGDIQLYMITTGLVNNTERAVNGFTVHGITSKKLNNKYFNRS